ncbi:hypothetical protein GYM54_20340 [Pseudomonas sp. MTM4]|uniref:hypothetical protein n=1 Tax=unclassified Pseudomonas TaxID=196821 RepID=UPI0018D238BD|nr:MULTISPECIES: hypothetical protein [unclassified Pseudomonas]MBC8650168.1 hypothetical protein [Pseudomonas sp. MT4]QXY93792.1 hypothetical protein GYM54_20340 [Pseudomonas sp. MTM4]
MAIGQRVSNDEVVTQASETIRRADPAFDHGWSTARIRAQLVPPRIWVLLLSATVIAIAGNALTIEGSAEHSASAKPLPVLLMMTEKPVRHTSP